jgi:sarcosine oxidase subunit beta
MSETADVVIIGGGVMGASIAFHLAQRRAGKVVLLERGGLATGTSGRSGAICRQHYSNPFTVRMARKSLRVFEQFDEAVGGDAGFQRTGMLMIVGPDDVEGLRHNVQMQQAEGVPARLISPDEISTVAPGFSSEGAALACFEEDAGVADPTATVQAFGRRARELGADIREGVTVTHILADGGKVRGVSTTQGEIESPKVVCAANVWSVALAREVGVELPIKPVRTPMAALRRPEDFGGRRALHPVCLDAVTEVYFRPDLNGWTYIGPMHEDTTVDIDPDNYEPVNAAEAQWFYERATRRVPALARAVQRGGWAGIYDMCLPDAHYILDETPQVRGFYLAVGFSGHGFKMSPEIGRMMAALVADGERDPDLHYFRYARFAEGDLIRPTYDYGVLG